MPNTTTTTKNTDKFTQTELITPLETMRQIRDKINKKQIQYLKNRRYIGRMNTYT